MNGAAALAMPSAWAASRSAVGLPLGILSGSTWGETRSSTRAIQERLHGAQRFQHTSLPCLHHCLLNEIVVAMVAIAMGFALPSGGVASDP